MTDTLDVDQVDDQLPQPVSGLAASVRSEIETNARQAVVDAVAYLDRLRAFLELIERVEQTGAVTVTDTDDLRALVADDPIDTARVEHFLGPADPEENQP